MQMKGHLTAAEELEVIFFTVYLANHQDAK